MNVKTIAYTKLQVQITVGCTNQKIDTFKSSHKLFLCVTVGLIKKTLEWQSIPSSENIVKFIRQN